MDTQNKNMIADIRSEQIDTFEETNTLEDGTVETATYKFFNVNGVFGKILDKLSYVRTHAAATWYNKLAGITVKDKIDELNSNLQAITNATTFGVPVDISEYTTDSPYIAPCNGYIRANSWGNANRLYYINGLVGTIAGGFPTFVYVIKGMKLAGGGYVESTNVLFYPLE